MPRRSTISLPKSSHCVVVACLLTFGFSWPGARAVTADETSVSALGTRLDAALAVKALRGARVGALVVRASDGSVLFSREPNRPMTPASNVKILTAIAALSTWGPSYRFETPVFAHSAPDANGAVRQLAVRGVGDPAINSEDWWMLANELRRLGVRRVDGDLILDDLAFDAVHWHPKWGHVSSRAYHAPVGALAANYGAYSVTVGPGRMPGAPAVVAVDPPTSYLKLDNRARTLPERSRSSLVVDRRSDGDSEKILVSGVVRLGEEPKTFYRSVLDPTLYAGAVLRMQLEAVGIDFPGRIRVGSVPDGSVQLVAFEGRPLREIIRLFMKYSNNAVAETLVKALGARGSSMGSWSSGVVELRRTLLEWGLEPQDFNLVDGSGLSYENRVTPAGLVRALRRAQTSFEFGPEFVSSLPIAALDGTLQERAEGARGEVRAKTGLLNGVTALSGYARTPVEGPSGGDLLVFSIMINGFQSDDESAMKAVDRFAAELVR